MSVSRAGWVLVVAFLISCSTAAPVPNAPIATAPAPAAPPPPASRPPPVVVPPATTAPVARQLAHDEILTTTSGATLTVDKGWFVTVLPDLVQAGL
jgi:hypothetical protein